MTDDSSVTARFGASAQSYVTSAIHSTGYSLDKLVELVAPTPGKCALDLATGGGHVAIRLSQGGAWVIASDITLPILSAARGLMVDNGLSMALCNNDAARLPFPDAGFDIVTTRMAPHHFPDVPGYLAEVARVLKPGGVFGLVDHVAPLDQRVADYVNAYEKLRDPSHNVELSQPEWEYQCDSHGLKVTFSEVSRLRLNFGEWTKIQNNDAETVLRLRVLLRQAPKAVAAWLEPETPDHETWFFTRWQIVLVATKAVSR